MSVYTSVNDEQLRDLLLKYSVGELVSWRGISDGMENSNFHLQTAKGRYVLTLFEVRTLQELPYYLDLIAYLSAKGVSCARPEAMQGGGHLSELNGKPAALFECLPGDWIREPTAVQCELLGHALGTMHRVGVGFTSHLPNDTGLSWMQGLAEDLAPRVEPDERELLGEELAYQQSCRFDQLPKGVIHGDLFRDNVLFTSSDQISGMIDFYNACDDLLLYDVAITVNDWCVTGDGVLDHELTQSLLRGYKAERPFTPVEHAAWSPMLRRAALRFWLSRLREKHNPRSGEMALYKDPDEFKALLLARRVGGVVLSDAEN